MADLGGHEGHAPPSAPKFFRFHAVFRKIWQNRMLVPPLGSWCPPPGSAIGNSVVSTTDMDQRCQLALTANNKDNDRSAKHTKTCIIYIKMYYIVLKHQFFNKRLIMQASSHTCQSTHQSYSFEFWNSNSTTAAKVDPVHLFLSLSSATVFELEKLSFTVYHCRSPFRRWPI